MYSNKTLQKQPAILCFSLLWIIPGPLKCHRNCRISFSSNIKKLTGNLLGSTLILLTLYVRFESSFYKFGSFKPNLLVFRQFYNLLQRGLEHLLKILNFLCIILIFQFYFLICVFITGNFKHVQYQYTKPPYLAHASKTTKPYIQSTPINFSLSCTLLKQIPGTSHFINISVLISKRQHSLKHSKFYH